MDIATAVHVCIHTFASGGAIFVQNTMAGYGVPTHRAQLQCPKVGQTRRRVDAHTGCAVDRRVIGPGGRSGGHCCTAGPLEARIPVYWSKT